MRTVFFPALGALALGVSVAAAAPGAAAKSRTPFEQDLLARGFADVQDLDPTLKVELKYASPDNFMGEPVYGDLTRAYLRRGAARKLATAHARLKLLEPGLTLLVADGLRPRHVQRRMWELVRGTPRQPYVADPRSGSMHNYGCAVDVTIVGADGARLDMGTPMDHFGPLSEPRLDERHLREGKLSPGQVANRRLLRRVMVAGGFRPLELEWWHFDAFDKGAVRRDFALVE